MTTNTQPVTQTYTFFEDPGHGWLAVSIEELKRLGIAAKISDYSYRKGEIAFLEEDCDFTTFAQAKEAAGEPFTYRTVHQDPTPIRNYNRY